VMIAIDVDEDLALAEEYSEKSVRLKIEAGYEKECISTINNFCLYYLRLGEIQKAQKSSDQLSNLVNKYFPSTDHHHSMVLFILGRIYQNKGDLNQALDYFNQALGISKLDLSIPSNLTITAEYYYSISQIFYHQNEYEKSLKYSIKALVIQETQSNTLYLSRTLFQLILITLKMNRLPQANSYLAKLDTLIEKSDPFLGKTISAYHGISKAFILLKDERTHSRAEAQKLFEKLIQNYKSEYQIVILAHLNLCELLIEELKQYGNPSILEEIEELLGKILEISEQTGSHALVGEILLLHAQIEFFQLKLQETNTLIEKALNLATEKGLTRLETRVLEVQSKIQNEVKASVQVAKQAPELLEKLEKSQLNEYIEDMKKMVELMRTS
ncbi:MAG: tetratricopeptide repeat protein, partial [Candidatus Heimdallarchaeota archaeon]